MNILEHYIEKIISEEEYNFSKEYEHLNAEKWVKVKMLVDCYGAINETERIMTVSEWEEIKKKGYYMA